MILLGLAGPPGAGKRTVAEYLRDRRGFMRVFGTAIGAMRAFCSMPGVVVLDVTRDYEAEYIRHRGGQIWLIQRPGCLTRAGAAYFSIMPHGSDRGLLNDGPLAALYNRVDKLLDDLAEQAPAT